MRVLIVDDDPFAGDLTSAILEAADHHSVLAANGVEALEILAAANDFDLIISDQNMPLITGIELFRELRAQGVTTPFILLSGDDPAGPSRLEPALDGCLMKDSSLYERLPEAMAAALARRGA